MDQQRKEAQQQSWFSSRISILGYFANKLNYHSEEANKFYSNTIDQSIRSLISLKKTNTKFTPLKIYVESNTIAVIDNQQKGWIVTDFLAEPICLSDMLRLKIYKISLGYSQLIANTKQGCLLLVWGNKKAINEQNLQEYTVKNTKYKYSQLFQVFKINNSTKNDSFFFSNLKKVIDQNSLFSVSSKASLEIITYPKLSKIVFQRKVVGLSVGNRHKLYWDQDGKLYSWGQKSLALGLSNFPQQQEIKDPQQITKLQGHVIKAYAGYNYSLAITLEGKLYEWGIKKIYPTGEQLIFQPRGIKLPQNEKPIDVKGKVDRFGILTMKGNLYLWGKNMKEYISSQVVCHRSQRGKQSQLSYNHPVLANNQTFILDFQISTSFLGIIYADRKLYKQSENQKSYWLNLKEHTRQTVRNSSCKLKTETAERKKLTQTFYSSRGCASLKKFKDPVQLALNKHEAKQMYLCAASQPQKLLNYILSPSNKQKQWDSIHTEKLNHSHSPSLFNLRQATIQKKQLELSKTMKLLYEEFQRRKQFTKYLQKGVMHFAKKPKIFRVGRNNEEKTKVYLNAIKVQKSYEQRLQMVLRKKQNLNQQFIQKILQSQQKNSLEYRMLKKKEYQELKNKHKEIQICKNSIQKTFIKAFLIKLFTKPLVQGRQLKIMNFAKNLKLHRLQKNIKSVFVKNRIRMRLNILKKNQLTRFFLLLITFKKYVKKCRQRIFQTKRQIITRLIVKKVVREKIKIGISTCNFNVRKLHKFREWLVLVKNQRKKCLKYLWKIYLLSMMSINSDNESSAIFYLPKNLQDISFQSIYLQKVASYPLLKLSNFLNKHSIFRIKTNYFQKLVSLFSSQNKKMSQIKQFGRFSKIKKGRIKFAEDDQSQDKFNLTQTDLLPYSLHYNILIHPSNYDLNVSQLIKMNEKWIKQEKKILDRHIQMIIQNHERQYLKKRRSHEIELSNYIKKNYQLFAQKRWKYIIQYNKLQKTIQKQKKEKQLGRLMKLTGSQQLLDEDCIPEKHAILDQALKRADSPPIPSHFIVFRQTDFKVLFRSYYESVTIKLKEVKRSLH